MYLPYVYLVSNIITNQFYYGFRYRNISLKLSPENDLWNRYFTSSKRIKELVTLYGKESFSAEVVFRDLDSEICYWKEQEFIKNNIDNPLCLNMYYVEKESGSKKFTQAGITEAEKQSILLKKMNYWTEENVAAHSRKISIGHAAMTIEEKRSSVDRVLKAKEGKWEEIGKLISIGHKNRTSDEQQVASKNYSNAQKKKYQELSLEEKSERSRKISESVKLMHQQRSEEEKRACVEKRRQTMKKKLTNLD